MPSSAAFRVRYKMQRGDYVALTRTMGRKSPRRTALEIAAYVLAVILAIGLAAGTLEAAGPVLGMIASLRAPWWLYPLLVAGPLLTLLHPHYLGLIAAIVYRRNAIADRDVVLEFSGAAIEGGMTGISSRVGWTAVQSLIETPTHLFITVSRREALIVPRRAFGHDEEFRTLLGFIRARVAASVAG